MTTVGQELVAGLAARGVTCVFGIPGVHTIELYRGLPGSGIRHVTARHEQGAAFMADGFARVSGRPGVAFVVSGPGVTNALTAMAQSREDSVPVLIVSGVNRRSSFGKGLGLLHELPDQAAMVETLCPTFTVDTPDALGLVLDAAFAALTAGRPGPVHVQVPTDVMPLPCAALPAPAAPMPHPAPDRESLGRAAAALSAARRPVILVGGGVVRCDAALRLLAEALDAPVVQTSNARGLMHGHALTVAASPSLLAVRALIAAADQVLAVGTEFGATDYDMYVRGGFPDVSGMIRVDVCADQLGRHPAAIALHCRAEEALPALAAQVTPRKGDAAARASPPGPPSRAELSAPILVQLAVLEAIRSACPQARIVGDSTQPVYAGNLVFDAPFPVAWFNAATGYGALGYGPGAAVGAAIADPARPVICLIGDGGLQFSPGELRTARDEGLDVTFLVWNNAGFREIAEAMADAGAPVLGCDPSPLKLEPFAAACDLPFVRVTLDPVAIAGALAAGKGPRLIEIVVT